MFSKVLVANRGEIGVRIIRTLRNLGIQSVAVYEKSDRDSLHVSNADEAHCLGEGPASTTYLNIDRILDICQSTGADAIHPGCGFLSESSAFARACEAAGHVFIGPTPDQIECFSLKHRARELAQASNIPLLPGSPLLATPQEARAYGESIGFPVLLKSTAGGGGIGMQVCRTPADIDESFASLRQLGRNAFADDGVFLEKFVELARHIEVQAFGDGHGGILVLGDRDCSTQRRHQKVLEEAPAPGLSKQLRNAIHDTSRTILGFTSYRNAGTVEFIYDIRSEQHYFLEVNTRLQVEHGITEAIYGIDLVEWMIKLAANEIADLQELQEQLRPPRGHAIQARIYAEDPNKQCLPSAGEITHVSFPSADCVRTEHWISPGLTVSPLFDPLLAKIITSGQSRHDAISRLRSALQKTSIYGVETNTEYVRRLLSTEAYHSGQIHTSWLEETSFLPATFDVITPGTNTTVQDYPGRQGYWHVGIPPSGPFDNYSFRLGNAALHNPIDAAGLEITVHGPRLRFNSECQVIVTGAATTVELDGSPQAMWKSFSVRPLQQLNIGEVKGPGVRCYLLIQGGIRCPEYMGSRSTFTLGGFGGHCGRRLTAGDVLHFQSNLSRTREVPVAIRPNISREWDLRVMHGPHGSPDFMTKDSLRCFLDSPWKVHYNSNRTGIRLQGPAPEWARPDGGEAGLHPSNIHDNAYALGTIDLTGDTPVILGPDGPSLGGFVCPLTVVDGDRWKLGQLRADDTVRFTAVSNSKARQISHDGDYAISHFKPPPPNAATNKTEDSAVLHTSAKAGDNPQVTYRQAGDCHILIEFGPNILNIRLRFYVHSLMERLVRSPLTGVIDITPGIRSLQIHFNPDILSRDELLDSVIEKQQALFSERPATVDSRIVHLPLCWEDPACATAVEKYRASVRADAPWCPDNVEFIRRINGLDTAECVKSIVFDATYLVMGLGDVYLGAPVATPVDPRHRLVTTKYNPARTWTAENLVGIGGAYLCVYGVEGPGGYQLIGRTLQMWNRYRTTQDFEQRWLLRFFDQLRFHEVSAAELREIREDFPRGNYTLRTEDTVFDINRHEQFLDDNHDSIKLFVSKRDKAFQGELSRWLESGHLSPAAEIPLADDCRESAGHELAEGCVSVSSPVSGIVWLIEASEGAQVTKGQVIAVIESMKMEVEVRAPVDGTVTTVRRSTGQAVQAGQPIADVRTQEANAPTEIDH